MKDAVASTKAALATWDGTPVMLLLDEFMLMMRDKLTMFTPSMCEIILTELRKEVEDPDEPEADKPHTIAIIKALEILPVTLVWFFTQLKARMHVMPVAWEAFLHVAKEELATKDLEVKS